MTADKEITRLNTTAGSQVTPVIGFIEEDVTDLSIFTPSPHEVDRVFTRSIGRIYAMRRSFNSLYMIPYIPSHILMSFRGAGEERSEATQPV